MAESKIKGARAVPKSVDYVETLMYGRYQKDLGEFARKEAARIKAIQEKRRKKHPFKQYEPSWCDPIKQRCSWLRYIIASKIGEDWLFLTLLGVVMALLSFLMDYAIDKCQEAYKWLYAELHGKPALQFMAWVAYPLIFISFSTGFVHIVGPNAIGSGIPEMKTILRGVILKEYLTFRTLISKMVGLCTSLGSGLLIGKEGPFVHVASITATLLGKLITSFHGIYENVRPQSFEKSEANKKSDVIDTHMENRNENLKTNKKPRLSEKPPMCRVNSEDPYSANLNESRNSEMLAAACAVGVACTFAAPIGGVLFSIEVTATYFAVRNYWRGFYSAVCGAFVFRLLAIFFKDEETLTALFKTSLRQDLPFDPIELFVFALIGLVCGFAGPLFVYTHRKIVEFIRGQRRMSTFLQKNRFIFPAVVVLILSSLNCPLGLGQYMAGDLTNGEAVNMLFSNITWATGVEEDVRDAAIIGHWKGPHNNLYVTLTLFILMRFWMTAIAITLPVPAGVFMPVFTIGAAFGRLVGEAMAAWFPMGIGNKHIVPGGYAIVGAAALSGSVTHTISTSVIVFELTGQMGHVLPAVIAVLISNAIAHQLQLSIYDSLIQIKKLPYLPDMINPTAINAHSVVADDFMVKKVNALTVKSSYHDMYDMLQNHNYRSYPLVHSTETMLLLGSIQRLQLEQRLEDLLTPGRDMTFIPSHLPVPDLNPHSLPDTESEVNTETSVDNETQQRASLTDSDMSSPLDTAQSTPSKRQFRFSVSRVDDETAPSPKLTPKLTPMEPVPEATQVPKSILKRSTFESPDVLGLEEIDTSSILDIELVSHWERIQLERPIDFATLTIDPAPFQVVPQTSLYKIHTIFSLLNLNHAYVTCAGKLVGVIGLKEVREAVQGHVNKTHEALLAMPPKKKKPKKGENNPAGPDNTSDA